MASNQPGCRGGLGGHGATVLRGRHHGQALGDSVIKVLLVEDDPVILDLTAYVLRRERFVVVEASDGAHALRRLKADRPDIVVLDLGLPVVDGFEVIRRMRAESETPILVVTGRKEAQDLLRCFDLGSDDFIPKPYQFPELTARIRAILRRVSGAPREVGEPRFQLDDLILDPETYEVTMRNALVRLTPTEFRILYLLATNTEHVVPASRIYTYVWGSDGGDANALRSHISHLRHKLGLTDSGPGTITSVPGVGYVMRRLTPAPAPALAREEALAASD
jgi:two-component system OmpR family response regulator